MWNDFRLLLLKSIKVAVQRDNVKVVNFEEKLINCKNKNNNNQPRWCEISLIMVVCIMN